nr:hypothetical protein [Tanacetum cinerariifolium]
FTFPIEGMRSIISMVSISLEGFLPSILLVVVIIVSVVIVAVILVVVAIDAIVAVVIVVASIESLRFWSSNVSFNALGKSLNESFHNFLDVCPGDAIGLFYFDRLSVCIPPRQVIIGQGISLGPVFLLGLSAFAIASACASRAAATPSVISCQMVASIIAGLQMLMFSWEATINIYMPTQKIIQIKESNIGYSDITRYGGKIAGKKTSMSERYLVKLFEESGQTLPGEAEKQFRMFVEEKVFSISESDGTIVE